jgi:AraC family transcriptional regulator, transcriptional activator FtrA
MNVVIRAAIYLAALVIPVTLVSVMSSMYSMSVTMPLTPDDLQNTVGVLPAPGYDAAKPTVVVVLGNELSEVTDVLGPYATFAESGLYNVYTVAETRLVRTLTGGLDIIPHFSFAELKQQLGHSPDIVVVPAMISATSPQNQPVLTWLRQQSKAGSLMFSWCFGAEVLAAAGLLDGKPATTHWGDIDGLEKTYPEVQWQRGVRFVDTGAVLTTAGLTSGFDATLYLLSQRHGLAVAERVRQALHYPLSPYMTNPNLEQYHFAVSDVIYLFNSGFDWSKTQAGVWLYDGVDDLSLAALFDVYPASQLYLARTVAAVRGPVTSHYGLQLLPRWAEDTLPTVDRLLVPTGAPIQNLDAELSNHNWGNIQITYLHNAGEPRFAFEVPLEDLAREQNVPTAVFAAKRLEYRNPTLHLTGTGWPVSLMLRPVVIAVASIILVGLFMRRGNRRQPGYPMQQPSV